MNSRIKNMRCIMCLGIIMIFLSGVGFLFSNITNNLFKLIVNTLIGIGLLTLATNLEDNDKFASLGSFSFFLSLLSFLISYIFIGEMSLFGSSFSFYGNLSSLFMASLWLVVILLATLMLVRYKEYRMTHIICLAILAFIFSILNHFNDITLYNVIAIAIIILLLNIVKINNSYVSSFAKNVVYLFGFLSIILVLDSNYLLSGILLFINLINILLVMKSRCDVESELLSILLIGILSIFYAASSEINYVTTVFIVITLLSLLEIIINYANLINNKGIKLIFKIGINIFYIIALLSIEDALTIAILSAVLFSSSIVNIFIYKNDALENYIIPLKVIILFIGIMNLLDYYFISLEYFNYIVSFNFISLILAKVSKKKFKSGFAGLTLICSFMMVLEDLTITNFLILCLAYLINYLVLFDKNNKATFAKIYYTILMLCLFIAANDQVSSHMVYLIAGIICGLLIILNKDDRYSFGLTVPFFYFYIANYIDSVVLNISISTLLIYILAYICIILFVKKVCKEEKNEAILGAIFLSLIGLNILFSEELLLLILLLAISIGIAIYCSKNNNYKACYYVGLVFSVLGLMGLINYLSEISIFIYLLLFGILIILIVIKLSSKDPKEDEDKKVLPHHNYCGNCGHKLDKNDKFCGNCGERCDYH